MTDIAHIIQLELDQLNHSVEPFANYGRHIAAVLSRLTAPPPEGIARLIEQLAASTVASCTCNTKTPDPAHHKGDCRYYALESAIAALRSLAQEVERTKDDLRRVQSVYDFAALTAERDALAQEVERLKTEHINAEMAHGALHAIHELLDNGGVPRGTFADDHVRNLVAMYNQRGMRIRELEGELATWKDISVTIEKARAAIRAKTIEECKKAIVNVRFGAPSNWGSDRPRRWHLDRPCTPEEASHHDNGCNDAFMAVSALATAPV